MTAVGELTAFGAFFVLGATVGGLLPVFYLMKRAVIANVLALCVTALAGVGFVWLCYALTGGVIAFYEVVATGIGLCVSAYFICAHLRSKTLISHLLGVSVGKAKKRRQCKGKNRRIKSEKTS